MDMTELQPWNLGLRFGLELAALAGGAAGAWSLGEGHLRWLWALAVVSALATVWGTFNVAGDPSRSGSAPVEVPGAVRLLIELMVLSVGAIGLHASVGAAFSSVFISWTLFHYLSSLARVRWLLSS